MMDKLKNIKKQRKKIVEGLELTYKKLIEFKKRKNTPLIVSRDGKVIELDPKEAQPTTIYKWH